MRRHQKFESMSLDIRPVMNLMVVLIPLLLAGSVWTKLAIKQLNLPPKNAGGGQAETEKPMEVEKRLGLNIIVSKKGFYIGSRSGFLKGEEEGQSDERGEPSVPIREDGSYNFTRLQERLVGIKERVSKTDYSDKKSVMLTAEADIEYKFIIKTMDNVVTYSDENGELQELFPQIIIGQVVI